MRVFIPFLTMAVVLWSGVVCAQVSLPDAPSVQGQGGPMVSAADAKAAVSAAHEKLERGDPNEAVATLEKLAAGGVSGNGLQHELGLAYYRSGKLVAAEQTFARAMAEDANDIESVQMRGLSLYRLGRSAEAIPYLERVRQWTPNANADANYILGICYLNAQRLEDARAAFAAQFGVAANSGAAYLLLGKMLIEANLREPAAEAAKKALELSPKLPMAHFILGELYSFKSETDAALREFELEREVNPGNAEVYERLGDVYLRAGQYQKAQEALGKALSLDAASTGPFILMGKVLLKQNEPRTSLLYLQHAEKMDPGNYVTHTLLAQAYHSLGQEDAAKKEMDLAAKIHTSDPQELVPAQ